jgi:hypothetical protein
LLGHWKNFDELESNLSLDELTALLNASREKEDREMRFLAAVNGVELEDSTKELEDISDLRNSRIAQQEGFGTNEGLGFLEL